ncbi:MAG: hypothetical protein ABIT09_02885 [Croceibacterium sp.]
MTQAWSERRQVQLFWLALAMIYGAVYARSLGFGFFDDDFHQQAVTWRTVWPTIRADPQFRPLFWVMFPLTSSTLGPSPFAHHLVNHALHLSNCALAYAVFRERFGGPRAAVAVIAWNLLPQLAFSLGWIAERNDPLFTLFLLGSIRLHDRRYPRLAWLAALCSYLSKVTALAFPLAFTTKAGLLRYPGDRVAGWSLIAVTLCLSVLAAYDDPLKPHLAGFGIPLLAINAAKNVIAGVIGWLVPAPFLAGPVAITGWGVCLLATATLLAKYARGDAAVLSVALIAGLLALPFAKNAELRISYAFSLFAIAAIIGAIRPPPGDRRAMTLVLAALAGLAAYGLPATAATVEGFKSDYRQVRAQPPGQDAACAYPVAFYPWMRAQEIAFAQHHLGLGRAFRAEPEPVTCVEQVRL